MHIRTERHVDAGERDADGLLDYCYEYDCIFLCEGNVEIVARSYIDTPQDVHLLSVTTRDARVGERSRNLVDADLETDLFVAAVRFLRDSGKTRISWLSGRGNGYEPLASDRP